MVAQCVCTRYVFNLHKVHTHEVRDVSVYVCSCVFADAYFHFRSKGRGMSSKANQLTTSPRGKHQPLKKHFFGHVGANPCCLCHSTSVPLAMVHVTRLTWKAVLVLDAAQTRTHTHAQHSFESWGLKACFCWSLIFYTSILIFLETFLLLSYFGFHLTTIVGWLVSQFVVWSIKLYHNKVKMSTILICNLFTSIKDYKNEQFSHWKPLPTFSYKNIASYLQINISIDATIY